MDVLVRNATGIAVKNATAAAPGGMLGTLTGTAGALPDAVSGFAATHRDGIEALCIVAGLVVAFCGRVILRPVVFLLGFLPTLAASSFIGLSLITDLDPDKLSTLEAIALGVSAVLAILVGLISLKMFFRVAVFGICGIMGAFLLLTLSLYFPPPSNQRELLLRNALAGVAAICTGFLAMYWRETSAIFGTAVDGTAIAVYALARFLGKRPQLFDFNDFKDITVTSHWWRVFYASFTLGLAFFAALMQLRLSSAEDAIRPPYNNNGNSNNSTQDKGANGYTPVGDLENGGGNNGHNDHAENELELPKSPPYSNEDDDDFGSGYGATDHQEYSVAENIGAPPLSSHILGNSESEQTTPRMTRLKGSPFSTQRLT